MGKQMCQPCKGTGKLTYSNTGIENDCYHCNGFGIAPSIDGLPMTETSRGEDTTMTSTPNPYEREIEEILQDFYDGSPTMGYVKGNGEQGDMRSIDFAKSQILELINRGKKEARLLELRILERHIEEQIVESTVTTSSLLKYITDSMEALKSKGEDV